MLIVFLVHRSVLALQAANQDPSLLDQMSKNVTRQGITPATLNYLRVRSKLQLLSHTRPKILINRFSIVVRHSRTNAGTHVPAQGLRPQPTRLSKNHSFPKVAADGCTTR